MRVNIGLFTLVLFYSSTISIIQSLVQKQKSVTLPKQAFDAVTPSAAEQEQCFAERIKMQLPLDNFGKSVNGSPQIGVACHQINLRSGGQIPQHNSRTRASSVSGSTSAGREICNPFFSIWIAEPVCGTVNGTIAGIFSMHCSRRSRRW